MSKARKSKMIGANPVISGMLTGGGDSTQTKRPQRAQMAKPGLPDWAKEGYKPPYETGSGLKDVQPRLMKTMKKKKTKTGVTRPYPFSPGSVLTPKF